MRSAIRLFWFVILSFSFEAYSQELYSARGYWEESSKPNYLSIKQRLTRGDSLTTNEITYLKDYETYLANYFQRMPETEKQEYEKRKDQWNKELIAAEPSSIVSKKPSDNISFAWRGRDRFVNATYGIYYGASLAIALDVRGAATAGIPLITGGLWLLGPAINPKKFEGISRNSIRAANTGRMIGLGYGASLGLAFGGGADQGYKWVLGLSSIGSIAMGEAAFQLQKQHNTSIGQIELMRHYGLLFPLVGASLMAAGQVDSPNLYGVALLGGGVTGLLLGKSVSKKYDYTQGDVDALSTLSVISTGVGFTIVAGALGNKDEPSALILIPAATSVIGTVLGQRSVKGIHLTDKQGSTIGLSTAGAALIGFGIVTMAQSKSPTVIIGVPSALALVTHQILFKKFKIENLEMNLKSDLKKRDYKLSLHLTPENYLLAKKYPPNYNLAPSFSRAQNTLFNLKLTF